METQITITAIDLEKWKKFQKYYTLFDILDKNGIFEIQWGKVTLNIAKGQVQNIIKENMVWKL